MNSAISLLRIHLENLLNNGMILVKEEKYEDAVSTLMQVIEIKNALRILLRDDLLRNQS